MWIAAEDLEFHLKIFSLVTEEKITNKNYYLHLLPPCSKLNSRNSRRIVDPSANLIK